MKMFGLKNNNGKHRLDSQAGMVEGEKKGQNEKDNRGEKNYLLKKERKLNLHMRPSNI